MNIKNLDKIYIVQSKNNIEMCFTSKKRAELFKKDMENKDNKMYVITESEISIDT